MHKSNDYRTDIDGLRALAVLSVILFHISHSILPGGFVGVDIFFVISGYLISLNLFTEISEKRFSLTNFYYRRVKRIVPVMLVVCLVVTVIAQLFMIPEDAEDTARSAFWSLFSLANVYFWLNQDTSYFASASEELPLLHLWSLGVEEQFYLIWPVLLMILIPIVTRKTIMVSLLLVCLASTVLAELTFTSLPMFTYYMLPTRIGELLIGAVVALNQVSPNGIRIKKVAASALSWLGLILLFSSFVLITKSDVFPGLWSLLPTVGAGLIIFSGTGHKGFVQKLLSIKIFVFLGLISYSAYMWHWPILAFYRYANYEINLATGSMLFGVIICVSWLSYQYIETPSRRSKLGKNKTFVYYFGFPVVILGIIFIYFLKTDGFGLKLTPKSVYLKQVEQFSDEKRATFTYDYVCQGPLITDKTIANERCIIRHDDAITAAVSTILWGDSNAAHFVGAIAAFAKESGFSFKNIEHSSCPPLAGDPTEYVRETKLLNCIASLKTMWPYVKQYKNIIISASWSSYQSKSSDFLEQFYTTVNKLLETADNIVIIGKAPTFSDYDGKCWLKELNFSIVNCSVADRPISERILSTNDALKDFAKKTPKVEYYDFNSAICPNGMCSIYSPERKPLYIDYSHLSIQGSWGLGQEIIDKSGVPYQFMRFGKNITD
jgi:peptidoglycan/LPS O-acetylase OafA/YrhL